MHFYILPRKFFIIKDLISAALMVTIPLIIIIACNVAILIKLALRKRDQAQLGVNRNESTDHRMNAMLIGIMLAFILFNSPIQIYVIALSAQGKDVKTSNVSKIMVLLMNTARVLARI